MIYGYIRVSTDKQDNENQRFQINNFAKQQGFMVDKYIEEVMSGTKDPKKRQLGNLLKKMKSGDRIICVELSRLGRTLLMIMGILNECMNRNVQVWTIRDNYRLGDDISSKVLAFAFGLSAEIERNLISQRTKEALARKRAEGVVLGRPIGAKSSKKKLDEYEGRIVECLNKGLSISGIARLLNVHRLTVSKLIEEKGLTKHRTHYSAYSVKKSNNEKKATVRLRNAEKQFETKLLNDEIMKLYAECGYSCIKLANKMNVEYRQLKKMLEKRGLFEKISEASAKQGAKNKSDKIKKLI